jgi:Carboxylesterase family
MKNSIYSVRRSALGLCAALVMTAGAAMAQVPPNIESELRRIGQIVDPACTAKLYRPLMPMNDINSNVTPLYPGVTLTRDISFGPDARDLADLFVPEKPGKNRTVLIFVPGGGGARIERQNVESNAFYDNVGRWGAKNGMVTLNVQRHPGTNWDDPGRDIGRVIQWAQANAAKYGGNPDRIFIWAHSAGNPPLGMYIGRPELWGPKGVGVKGAIFMSGVFNVAPLEIPGADKVPPPNEPGGSFYNAGATCGANAGGNDKKGGDKKGKGPGPGAPAPVDQATLVARSSLPEFRKTKVKLMFATAELDPQIKGAMSPFFQTLHDDICKNNPKNCPTMLFGKDESHISEVFGIDTADQTVSKPILEWIKKTK